jgi:hypothetical protein
MDSMKNKKNRMDDGDGVDYGAIELQGGRCRAE